MSDNKCIDKKYLLETLRNFDKDILSKKYAKDNSNPGTGSDITISVEDGNAIEIKDDGIYVPNLSKDLDNINTKVESIKKYQKYLNTELEYGELHVSKTATNGLAYLNKAAGEFIPFDTLYQGNMENNPANYSLKLKAGKTYRLFYRSGTWNASDTDGVNYPAFLFFYNITKNEMLGYGTYCKEQESWVEFEMLYVPDSDCEVGIYIESTLNSVTSIITDYVCDGTDVFSPIFIAQEIGRVIEIDPVNYVNEKYGIEDCPVGSIISIMGNTIPKHYLSCDGSTYNIADYPHLSQFIKDEFGVYNHFGGDGINTFAVPDLRGEFLRGAGNNGHINNSLGVAEGNGGNVGEHQDATIVSQPSCEAGNWVGFSETGRNGLASNADTFINSNWTAYFSSPRIDSTTNSLFTIRTTNTSVLWCIKYEPTYFLQLDGSALDINEIKKMVDDAIDVHTETLKDDIRNGYQKILNEDIQWFSSVIYTNSVTIPGNSILTFNKLADNPANMQKANKMFVKDNGYIQLKAGHTYVLDAAVMAYGSFANIAYYLIDEQGKDIDTIENNNANKTNRYSRFAEIGTMFDNNKYSCIYTPENDCAVALALLSDTNIQLYCYAITIYELKQPVYTKIDVGSYVDQIGVETQDSPVGTIISYMGNNTPKSYLACDGTIYNISDYPDLANHFKAEFGIANHFGGDGTTTFAVPDLRGEFLRGAGDNIHPDQGNGDNPGVHQDGTSFPHLSAAGNGSISSFLWITDPSGNSISTNRDDVKKSITNLYGSVASSLSQDGNEKILSYIARPTNTSVQYCIKYQPTYVLQFDNPVLNYSQDEHLVGFWINGKPLYEKTIVLTGVSMNTTTTIRLPIDVEYDGFISIENMIISNESNPTEFIDKSYNPTYILDNKLCINVRYTLNDPQTIYLTLRYTKPSAT